VNLKRLRMTLLGSTLTAERMLDGVGFAMRYSTLLEPMNDVAALASV
jgi:hypothetical protein